MLAGRDDHKGAERAYSEALQRDSSWFYHHLKRGISNAELGRNAAARSDLQASIERMPTAVAYYGLGIVERQSGNRNGAIENFRIAAQSDSPVGQSARKALQEMGAG